MAARHEFADGDVCPVRPAHGKMFMQPTSAQWCSHQEHDIDGTPSLYEYDGVTPRRRTRAVGLTAAEQGDNVVAFTLPKEMKSALDSPAPKRRTQRQRDEARAEAAVRMPATVTPASAPVPQPKVGVPSGGPGDVCRRPKVGNALGICGNCGRVLVPSQIRKSGVEHAK